MRALALALGAAGVAAIVRAIWSERQMQRHRRPGVTYAQVTLRRDGAWRRADLFDDEGLALQRQASKWGVIGIGFVVLGLAAFALSR